MASRFFAIGRFRTRERLALDLLRGGPPAEWNDDVAAFALLRKAAIANGLSIAPAGTTCVGPDEITLLALLAALQRNRPPPLPEVDTTLQAAVFDCAQWLRARGLWLHYRLTTPLLVGASASGRTEDRASATRLRRMPPSRLPSGSLEDRALLFAMEHGPVSTGDLAGIGISSHVIRTMRHRGLLTRVRHGVYAATPAGA
jgi:hypothetical protein